MKKPKGGNVDNYAFDIECTYDVETCNHSFAMIVIKKLYTNEEWIFHDIKEFHTFIENINKTKKISHLWGHNARGYDSFILFNIFYNEFNQTPSEIIRNGKKIMMMKYGVVKFLDSMNHISGSLNNLIPTFGLNIDDKGYIMTNEDSTQILIKPPYSENVFKIKDQPKEFYDLTTKIYVDT